DRLEADAQASSAREHGGEAALERAVEVQPAVDLEDALQGLGHDARLELVLETRAALAAPALEFAVGRGRRAPAGVALGDGRERAPAIGWEPPELEQRLRDPARERRHGRGRGVRVDD